MSKNNHSWQPTASIEHLRQRAQLLETIRAFFRDRHVLEVTTPVLSDFGVTDPHLESLHTTTGAYLQTSPEYYMKRLLAAGSGSIYQIGPAFRAEEVGSLHNQEFTMLEWYRVGMTHLELMDEVDELLQVTLQTQPAQKLTYQACFEQHLGLDPHLADQQTLINCAVEHQINAPELTNKDDWLSLLITHLIEPHLGRERPLLLYDFPASQAALAKIRPGSPPVAERFELYYQGVELANGYHELTDTKEQQARFTANNLQREAMGLATVPIDPNLIEAMAKGLPESAGVALGFDRLLMLHVKASSIHHIMSFGAGPR